MFVSSIEVRKTDDLTSVCCDKEWRSIDFFHFGTHVNFSHVRVRVRVSILFLGSRIGMYMCTPLRTVKEIGLQNKNSEPPLHAKTVFQDFEEV